MNKQTIHKSLVFLLALCASAAQADLAVVVSANSKVGTLTRDQVVELFLGVNKDFPGGAGTALLVTTAGPLRDEFYAKVLAKDASQVKAIWSRLVFSGKGMAPREIADVAEVRKLIAANPSTIGFVDKAAVDPSLKVVFTP